MPKDSDKIKRLHQWIDVKGEVHTRGTLPHISNCEIWWYACGENVGVEINGKNKEFSRPVLIYRKLGRLGFMGIPLSSQNKEGSWYVPFVFNGKHQVAVLSQADTLSTYRLYSRIGKVSESDYRRIVEGFIKLYG